MTRLAICGRPYPAVVAQEADWSRQIEALLLQGEEQVKTRVALLAGEAEEEEGGAAAEAAAIVAMEAELLAPLTEEQLALIAAATAGGGGGQVIASGTFTAGPGRYCSPCHRMPFNSRNEG